MSFGGLTTFLNTTLLSILTFIMRLFSRSRPSHATFVTPYPLAPHLPENSVIAIGRDACARADGKTMDLEKGVLSASYTCPAARQVTQDVFCQSGGPTESVFNNPKVPKRNVSLIPSVVPHPFFRSVLKPSSTAMQDLITLQPAPLSVATNFARIPDPPRKTIPSQSQDENNNPTHTQMLRKDRSPGRKLRYFNLSPKKSPGTKISSGKTSISQRKTDRDDPHEMFGSSCGDRAATSLKLECNPSDEPIDWAARIRSVFYKNREVDEDLSGSVRELFSRDSRGSSFAGDNYHHSLSHSSSTPASSSPPCSESSELPYLSDTHASLSVSSSASSGAFNDLLASVERKYPGQRWKDVVKFSTDHKDGYKRANPYNGIAEGEKQQWSDVLCIDEYSH
ncbi:hypothetical protein B0H12DRAFT_127903 [Mycena haematopus]|nr:hypothetical protein B0H12DRAFT_127903 [Mycena haematopus]